MAQQTQQWRSGNGELAWLSALVVTMAEVSRPEPGAERCDSALLAAAEAHLLGPSVHHRLFGSAYSLRN